MYKKFIDHDNNYFYIHGVFKFVLQNLTTIQYCVRRIVLKFLYKETLGKPKNNISF